MACGTHLFNTDSVRLHFPLAGEMFDSVVPNIYMRPGYLNLDIFCPICGAFPFWPDGRKTGFRGVGRNLKTRGPDGKPKIMPVEDILAMPLMDVNWPSIDPPPAKEAVDKAVKELFDESAKEFPCPECGAKRNIHKKGCSKKDQGSRKILGRGKSLEPGVNMAEQDIIGNGPEKPTMFADDNIGSVSDQLDLPADHSGRIGQDSNHGQKPVQSVPDWIVKQVEKSDAVPPDAPPTEQELAELARERDHRAMMEKTSDTRPMEGV